MADFSFLSDSDDEKTVDQILSQAKDQIVLEQVAAINCSGFTDSVLPTHLESRFHKLKSFPASSKPKSPSLYIHSSSSSNLPAVVKSPKTKSKSATFDAKTESKPRTDSNSGFDSDENSVERKGLSPSKSFKDDIFSPSKKNPGGKMAKKSKSQMQRSQFEAKTESNSSSDSDLNSVDKKCLSPSKSFEDGIFSPSKKNPHTKSSKNSKFPNGSFSSWDSSTESTSPPKKGGCFWCSPKKVSRKKSSKENKILDMGFDWEKDDEFLSDLNTFSTKSQQKLLKKAMKEEEKINREAEKIVNWAKQASARMDVSGFEDELSDNDFK